MTLRATFTLKNLTDTYLASLAKCEPRQAYLHLFAQRQDLNISLKVGTGQMRDAVAFNDAFKAGQPMTFTLEPRKGYKLATFEVAA